MPRCDNLGANVNSHCRTTGNGSSTWDICNDCAERLAENPHVFDDKLRPYNGDPKGEDGRGENVEHPAYSDCDGYKCAVCNVLLTDEDN